MSDLLNDEQLEILTKYREFGLIAEFLEDLGGCEEQPFELPLHQKYALQLIWDFSFIYFVWARRLGKTFIFGNAPLGLAALLSGLPVTIPIGILSGSYKQVKLNFHEIISTYNRSSFIRSISEKPPRILSGHCEWRLKGHGNFEGHRIEAYPLNSTQGSDTLRGYGFPILFVDEFQLVPEKSYRVLLPAASASGNPMLRMKEKRETSIPVDKPEKNRIIFGGTGYYQFSAAYQKIYVPFERKARMNSLAQDILQEFSPIGNVAKMPPLL